MTDRIIPLLDLRTARLPIPPAAPGDTSDAMSSISWTDRCATCAFR
jgi:hypothetical protein